MVLRVENLWKIVGIISAALGQFADIDGELKLICNLGHYLVYTDVSRYNDWIDHVILETQINF
jgi:secreted trypsin-like serine protease